ncbi:MAG TPA: carbon monoxide dehydrogenase subunit G [Symbiobacteriaceae bacterium]|jgi:hypothetical protein
MQVTGDFQFEGPRLSVWALLNDPIVLARCTPGCEELTPDGPDRYQATVKIGLAAVKGTYTGVFRIADKQEPASTTQPATMTLQIEMSGSSGFVNVAGRMELADNGPVTRLHYDWDVQVGGPIAMVGQRVLAGVARWIIGDFFGAAGKELAARQQAG